MRPRDSKYSKPASRRRRRCCHALARCGSMRLCAIAWVVLPLVVVVGWIFGAIRRSRHGLQLHGDLSGATEWQPAPTPFFRRAGAGGAAAIPGLQRHGFNQALSDSLSLDRPTPDLRPHGCSALQYAPVSELPTTSVIFVFCDELLSTLLRSIHSVLNRSPPQLLHEIVLVNDGSRALNISALEANIRRLPAKITLLHHPKQLGLVQARLTGARAATGDTITVLDSHIEVQDGWLEPLMHRIHQDRRTVVVPHIRSIDAHSFSYRSGGIGVCGVLLSMVEHSIALQAVHARAQQHPATDPQPTPVMAGGLFSFDREFFFELGGYDEEMGFWGAENLEISFRIWMCGGRLELVPCSNVFHIFRAGGRPYSVPWTDIVKNKQRVIDVWMGALPGDAKFAAVARRFSRSTLGAEARGPIDHMMALREKLQCQSFEWFLQTVYPENYFTLFLTARATGSLRHVATAACLAGLPPAYSQRARAALPAEGDSAAGSVDVAHNGGCHQHGEFMLTADGQLRDVTNNDVCLTASGTTAVQSSICAWADRAGRWFWDLVPSATAATSAGSLTAGQLRHRSSQRCLGVSPGDGTPVLQPCGDEAANTPAQQQLWLQQQWTFGDPPRE